MFSSDSYDFLRRHWLHRNSVVRMRPISIHSSVRIKPCPKNKPASDTACRFSAAVPRRISQRSSPWRWLSARRSFTWPVHPAQAIYAMYGKVSAARFPSGICRQRTYSTEVTSSPSNLQLHRIIRPLQALPYDNKKRPCCQERFWVFLRKIEFIFVDVCYPVLWRAGKSHSDNKPP